MANSKNNLIPYLILFGGLTLGFFFFILFSYNRQFQLLIGVLISVFYLIWGITNHLIKKNLTFKIVIEYVLVAIIAIVIMVTLLLRT